MKRVFIIANGEKDLPRDLKDSIADQDLVVCADGGARYLADLDLEANLIVGDLDSLSAEEVDAFAQKGVAIRRYPRDKDASDLELAIVEALKSEPDELVCIAALGGRPDHALTNVALLGRYADANLKVSLLGADWQAQFITADIRAFFAGAQGDVLSLVPISKVVEKANGIGLKWPLADTMLNWGSSLTLSNEFAASSVSISIGRGLLLAFHLKQRS